MAAMTYNTLAAPKGAVGAIATWSNYSKLDIDTVITEAESLLFSILRVREMRHEWTFGVEVGQSSVALPARYLDPIGALYDITNGMRIEQNPSPQIQESRFYENDISVLVTGIAVTAGSSLVVLAAAGHGLTQGSTITLPAGSALPGAWPVTRVFDANFLTIDIDDAASADNVTSGLALACTANRLQDGYPSRYSVIDERMKFDVAFDLPATLKHLCYRAPKPLSADNPSHFITARYPKLMRHAVQAAASDFEKDDAEYQKHLSAMTSYAQTVMQNDDLSYRGADIGTDVP